MMSYRLTPGTDKREVLLYSEDEYLSLLVLAAARQYFAQATRIYFFNLRVGCNFKKISVNLPFCQLTL